jgi:hypothetical protein
MIFLSSGHGSLSGSVSSVCRIPVLKQLHKVGPHSGASIRCRGSPLHCLFLSVMFCTRCGAKNPDDAFFCSRCGTALIRSPPQQIKPPTIPPQQIKPPAIPPQQIKPQPIQPPQIKPQQIPPQRITPQQIEPQQPSRQKDVAMGAPERAVHGNTKGGAHPFLLVSEVIFSAVFAVLFNMMLSRYIFHGTISSPLTAAFLVTGFIIFFAGIHYGKVLRK